MMFSRLCVVNAFLTQDALNLQWVYWDITQSGVEEDLYSELKNEWEENNHKDG